MTTMKQMMTILLMGLMVTTAAAQKQKGNEFNQKLFDAKVSELVYRLDMTDEQKAKFIPVYRRYNEEMRAAWGERKKPQKPITDEERLTLTKQKMERQQRVQAVRMKYVDEFSTVLTASQVSRFYDVESKIQKKLMDRKLHGGQHGKQHGKLPGGHKKQKK